MAAFPTEKSSGVFEAFSTLDPVSASDGAPLPRFSVRYEGHGAGQVGASTKTDSSLSSWHKQPTSSCAACSQAAAVRIVNLAHKGDSSLSAALELEAEVWRLEQALRPLRRCGRCAPLCEAEAAVRALQEGGGPQQLLKKQLQELCVCAELLFAKTYKQWNFPLSHAEVERATGLLGRYLAVAPSLPALKSNMRALDDFALAWKAARERLAAALADGSLGGCLEAERRLDELEADVDALEKAAAGSEEETRRRLDELWSAVATLECDE